MTDRPHDAAVEVPAVASDLPSPPTTTAAPRRRGRPPGPRIPTQNNALTQLSELLESLAAASKRMDAIDVRQQRIIELFADIAAEVFCIQIGSGLRSSGLFGLPGLRFTGNSGPAAYVSAKERFLEYLRSSPVE